MIPCFVSTVKDPVLSANDIHQWAHNWKMGFNPDPTKQATEVEEDVSPEFFFFICDVIPICF